MIVPFEHKIKKEQRWTKYNHKSLVLWFTGLSGSGKSTIANRIEEELFKEGYLSYFIDADNIRSGLNKGLGFSDQDRLENIRRVAEVSKLFAEAGIIVLASFISPKKAERELAKSIIGQDFIEIFINCPLEICEKRDVKGIYKAYREGKIDNLIGIDTVYEIPENPDVELKTNELFIEEAVQKVLDFAIPKLSIHRIQKIKYNTAHLNELESEAIYIIREVAAQFERPVLLFSGGKDSMVLLHLAKKAFWPAKIPMTILHIDTGHNFPEVLEFRDNLIKQLNANLIVKEVQESIEKGRVKEETGFNASRNYLQTATLLDALAEFKFDAALGGGRRDEEKSRAKERFFSHRDMFGQWDPKNQRPELWNLFNGRKNLGEHFRIFPLSNFTELDIWHYIKKENLQLPRIYFSHIRKCIIREGIILACSPFIKLKENEIPSEMRVRFRTVGDSTCTGAVLSEASNVDDIIKEIAVSRLGERSARYDDKRSDSALEERKKEGYF